MDAIDRKLLGLLGANARLPLKTLAGEVGLARSTVRERIDRLEASGVIRGYRADLAPEAGPTVSAILSLTLTRTPIPELVAALGSNLRRRLEAVAVSNWGVDPWSRGAYSHALPGHANARARLRAPVEGRIFFAGEATAAAFYGTAHGAWMEGERAARETLAALGLDPGPIDRDEDA